MKAYLMMGTAAAVLAARMMGPQCFASDDGTAGAGGAPDNPVADLETDVAELDTEVDALLDAIPGIVSAAVAKALANVPTDAATAAASASDAAVKAEIAKVKAALAAGAPPAPPAALALDVSGVPATATVGVAYSGQVSASGGVGDLAITAEGLPDGLSITPSGEISGTPGTVGDFDPTFTVTDSSTPTAQTVTSDAVAIDVAAAPT